MISSRSAVETFLNDTKLAIQQNRVIPTDRDKNLRSLASLGITWADAIDEIDSLSYSNYINGPEPDYGRPGSDDLWVFKKRLFGETIYIKLKVLYQEDNGLKIISFHIDEM